MSDTGPALSVRPKTERQGARRAAVGTGATSLLMIFTVLCFATLAMLSLSTADNNRQVQLRSTQNSIRLAAAKGEAAVALAMLDADINTLWRREDARVWDATVGFAAEVKILATSQGWQQDGAALAWALVIPVDSTTELVTQIEVLPPGSHARYRLTGQSTRLTAGWQPEGGPGVWGA